MSGRRRGHLVAILAFAAMAACGKKGPPLPPLYIVPDAVSEATARRLGDEVRLRFVLPTKNLNGPDPVNIARVEIYAATVAAGAATPPNRELLDPRYRVGTVAVKPPRTEDDPRPEDPSDTRPAAGEVATFVEALTPEKLEPQFTTPATPAPTTKPPDPAATPAAQAPPPSAMRVYVIRGIAPNGRPGQPSPRLNLPLVPAPPSPTGATATFTESAVTIAWTPASVEPPAKPPLYNVYAEGADVPLNPAPLDAAAFERPGIEFGKEECFVVRSVARTGAVSLESTGTSPVCVTPSDVFPPADPTGLSAVASGGVISLIWNANSEADLAGYIVLRAEAPGDTLQPITPTPIRETTYRDTAVTPGVRYVYAIQAVDTAVPPNRSGESRRVEETAR